MIKQERINEINEPQCNNNSAAKKVILKLF